MYFEYNQHRYWSLTISNIASEALHGLGFKSNCMCQPQSKEPEFQAVYCLTSGERKESLVQQPKTPVSHLTFLVLSDDTILGASSLLQAAARQVQTFYKELEGDPKDWDNFWYSEGASFSHVTYPETVALTLSKSSGKFRICECQIERRSQSGQLKVKLLTTITLIACRLN